MIQLFKRASRAFGREDGNSTIEFVIVLPILFSIFMMSFESGLLMMRSVLLERATDMAMRELRTGNMDIPTGSTPAQVLAILKEEVCSRTVIINDCATSISIFLEPISQVTWTFPARGAECVDRAPAGDIDPSTEPDIGTQNELMLVRVCVLQKAIFPTLGLGDDRQFVGLGEGLVRHDPAYGEYGLVATSTFVNEPSS
jgi:hypothetical protein